ncbi:MAG: hypothetical protein RLZZ588_713 [Chloroflexota bacterium]
MNLKSLAFGLAALLFIGGCTSTPETSASLLYTATRSWSNGMEERVEVYADGKIIMIHGDFEERVTLPADQMAELATAATTPVEPGSNSDDPILGVTVSGSSDVRPAALTPGSIADLLNRLLDSHTLHE